MSLAINHFYRFGEFSVDSEQRVLLRNETPMPLAPKVFDTLLILIDNSGRIVEKDELMKRLWPDSFVEDSNLTFNIQQLRKSLGDNARQPRFIETVARRGYRFIAEVTKSAEPAIADEAQLSTTVKQSTDERSRTFYFSVAAISLLIVGSLVIALWLVRNRNAAAASSAPILSTPFKSEKFLTAGNVRAVMTPDGKYVAYTTESSGKESIWLRQLETSENIQIVSPTESRYFGLAISPDGNTLYFSRRTQGDAPHRNIYRVATFGGILVKVVEQTEGWIGVAPDGRQISFVRCKYEDEDFCSLFVVDVDGKNERRLLTRARPFRISDNQFSPDGKSVAFAAGQSFTGGSDFRLMRINLTSGAEHQISPKTFFEITNLKWLPGGENLLLAAKETHDGRLRIWHVSATTGDVHALTQDATDYIGFSFDKTADKMIATISSNTFHLYVSTLDAVSNPKKLSTARSGVSFTPEGKILYAGDDDNIWTINRDGGEQQQLTNDSNSDISPRMSPNNRYIFFSSNRSGTTHVWRMNADGSNQVQLTKQVGGYPRLVSNDGKWLYFFSSFNQNLWRVPVDGGEETKVSVPVSSFSPDGKLVAYFLRDQEDNNRFKLAVMSVEEQKIIRTFRLEADDTHPIGIDGTSGWVRDNKSFYYVTTDGSRNYLWRQMLDAESPQKVGDLGNEEIAHFAVAPDGLSIAFIRGRWIHNAVLIEGLK